MGKKEIKVRVTLSLDLLETLFNNADSELLKEYEYEITKVIGLIMLKHDRGALKPAYITQEIPLEKKAMQGLATEAELDELNTTLLDGLK